MADAYPTVAPKTLWQLRALKREFKVRVLNVTATHVEYMVADGGRSTDTIAEFHRAFTPYIQPARKP